MQPTQSYSVGGQRSSGQLTGKPAGAQPVYRGRWCTVSRGHPGPPKPSLLVALGQLCAAPWELQSTVGSGIDWTRTDNLQAIRRILHSTRTQAQDVRAPPTQAQDVRAPPTQAQDVRAPPTQAQDVRAPPTQAQDVRAPPFQAQDAPTPPSCLPSSSCNPSLPGGGN
ncbi:UNVERIFIED_CONTAM: hypothetical protein FKN15_063283 [Acipenser sinensis]